MSLIITGMHRSGTSAVAHIVAGLELSMGDGPRMASNYDNPRGFYEREDVAAFNDAWLGRFGGCWWAPVRIPEEAFARVPEVTLIAARDELRLFDEPAWFVKDPRIALLIPLWDRLALTRVPTVVCVRDPFAVADSLYLRNGFPRRRSLALWTRYMTSLLRHSDRPTVVLDYDRMLADPAKTVRSLADFAGVTPRSEGALADSLEAGLRRARTWEGEAPADFAFLSNLHQELQAAHGQPVPSHLPLDEPEWVLDFCYELSLQHEQASRQDPGHTTSGGLAFTEPRPRESGRDQTSVREVAASLTEMLEQEKGKVVAAQQRLTAEEAATSLLASRLDAARAELDALAVERKAERDENDELQRCLGDERGQRKALEDELALRTVELSEMAVRIAPLEAHLQRLSDTQQRQVAAHAAVVEQLVATEQALAVSREAEADLRREVTSAQDAAAGARQEMTALRRQMLDAETSRGSALTQLVAVQGEVDRLQSLCQRQLALLHESSSEIHVLQSDVSAAETRVQLLDGQRIHLTVELTEARDVVAKQRHHVEEQAQRTHELARAAAASVQELRVLRRMVEVADTLVQDLTRQERELLGSRAVRLGMRLRLRRTSTRPEDAEEPQHA